MNQHKNLKIKFSDLQQKSLDQESLLTARWAKEEEERKKRAEEEEETKYDYTSYYYDQKKPPIRKGGKTGNLGKKGMGAAGSGKAGRTGNGQAKMVGQIIAESSSSKRGKNGMTKR